MKSNFSEAFGELESLNKNKNISEKSIIVNTENNKVKETVNSTNVNTSSRRSKRLKRTEEDKSNTNINEDALANFMSNRATLSPADMQPEKISIEQLLNKNYIDKSPFPPTDEQENIIVCEKRKIKVVAFAGTGKTSTLVNYAKRRSRGRGLYIAFNKDMKEDALRRFPSNVRCMTSHGLAYAQFGAPLSEKLNIPIYWNMVYKSTGIPVPHNLVAKNYARCLLNTVFNFLASADDFIQEKHLPNEDLKLLLSNEKIVPYLPRFKTMVIDAEKLWKAMITPTNKEIGTTHDAYLKLMQLASPELPYDYIMLDEAQDSNPAVLDLVQKQTCVQILVGDPHQAIYGFRKAVDAMTMAKSDITLELTGSFRFGSEIADFANSLLVMKGETSKIKGLGKESNVFNINKDNKVNEGRTAFISRSNSCLFQALTEKVEANKKVYISGGIQAARFDLLEDLYHLYHKTDKPKDPMLATFTDYDEFLQAATDNEEVEWLSRCKLIEKIGKPLLSKIEMIKRNTVSDQNKAEQSFSTTHKAKGLEYDNVILGDDFILAPATNNEHNRFVLDKEKEEVNILYVATTRAKKSLYVGNNQFQYWKKISPLIDGSIPFARRKELGADMPGFLMSHFEKVILKNTLDKDEKSPKIINNKKQIMNDTDPFDDLGFDDEEPVKENKRKRI